MTGHTIPDIAPHWPGFHHSPPAGGCPRLNEAAAATLTRAMLALVESLTPGFTTRGGAPRDKTGKQREIDAARLDMILEVLARDLLVAADAGNTEAALRYRLVELGQAALILTGTDSGGGLRPTGGPWSIKRVRFALATLPPGVEP